MKELIIHIKDINDVNKFYKKLRFYKLFYKKRKLILIISKKVSDSDKEELLMCKKAFNIKDKDKRLEYIYDTLCDYHDKLYIDKNICEFDKNGLCICQREYHYKTKSNGCCGTCTYMGNKGCTIRSLACKTFFCRYIKSKKHIDSFRKTKLFKYFLSIPQKEIATVNYWTPREENLRLMKKNSYLYLVFKKDTKMKRW